MSWSVERVICDAGRYAKAVVAPVLAPLLDFVYPPLTEPTPKVCRAHHEKVCIYCDEDSDALWMHPADGATQLTEREAEEEVSEPVLPCSCGSRYGRMRSHRDDCDTDEARERIGEVDDFISDPIIVDRGRTLKAGGAADVWTEPALTADELVAVRQLIAPAGHPNVLSGCKLRDARCSALCPHCERAADEILAAGLDNQKRLTEMLEQISHRYDPERGLTPAYIAMCLDIKGVRASRETFTATPDLATWLEPAVMTALDKHRPVQDAGATVYCRHGSDDGYRAISVPDWDAWYEHVTPLICKHIAQALPDYPNPQQKGK